MRTTLTARARSGSRRRRLTACASAVAILSISLAACSSSGGSGGSGGSSSGQSGQGVSSKLPWCGPQKAVDRAGRRLRRQHLARADPLLRGHRRGPVPERDQVRVRQRRGEHPEGDLRHQRPGRAGHQRDRRFPRRRQGDAASPDQGLPRGHHRGAVPGVPRRRRQDQLQRLHLHQLHLGRSPVGQGRGPGAARQGQRGVPRRPAGELAEPGRVPGAAERVQELPRHPHHRPEALQRDQLGPGDHQPGGVLPAGPLPEDRRRGQRLRDRPGAARSRSSRRPGGRSR